MLLLSAVLKAKNGILLLDEFEEAKQRFEALTEQEQEQFKAFPIGKFLIEEMI